MFCTHKGNGIIAISVMTSFAKQINYTDCWICQKLLSSSTSPMLTLIPLSLQEVKKLNYSFDLISFNACSYSAMSLFLKGPIYSHVIKKT